MVSIVREHLTVKTSDHPDGNKPSLDSHFTPRTDRNVT